MSKTTLALTAKFLVTALLLTLVLRNVEIVQITARLAELSILPLVAAAGLIAFQSVVVVTWRWETILATIDQAPGPWRLTGVVMISHFFNQVLPSTVGGDGMRMWLLRRRGRPLGAAVRSVIIDRLLGLLGLLLLSLIGTVALIWRHPDSLPLWGAATVSLVGILVIAGAPLLLRLFTWLPVEALRRNLGSVAQEVETLGRDKPLMFKLIAASVLGHIAICLAIWSTAVAIGVDIPLLQALAVLPAIMLAAAMPVSVAGWGVREGGMVLGLGLLGVATSDAALVSIFFGLLQLAFGAGGGLVWLLQRGPKPNAEMPADLEASLATASTATKADTE